MTIATSAFLFDELHHELLFQEPQKKKKTGLHNPENNSHLRGFNNRSLHLSERKDRKMDTGYLITNYWDDQTAIKAGFIETRYESIFHCC